MAKKSKKQSGTKKEQKTENTKKTKKKQSDTRMYYLRAQTGQMILYGISMVKKCLNHWRP